jgi:Fe-S-cluster containining protein
MKSRKQRKQQKRKQQKSPSADSLPTTGGPAVARDQSGRVHLIVRTNPRDGRAVLALRAPLFNEPWQNEIAASAANSVYQTLNEKLELAPVLSSTRALMDATSKLADGLLARAANGSVACKAGCDHCCYQSVGVTPAEALTIVAHLHEHRSEGELLDFKEHIRAARERTRSLSAEERFSPEHPCPFLKDARCTIYEVRPLSCRGMNSLDANECSDNLRDPEARARFVRDGSGGRSFLEPIRAFHAISAGLQLSLSEVFHLDMRPLDLTAAVHELLNGSPELTGDWLSGKPALAMALGGDSTKDPRSRELIGAVPSARQK